MHTCIEKPHHSFIVIFVAKFRSVVNVCIESKIQVSAKVLNCNIKEVFYGGNRPIVYYHHKVFSFATKNLSVGIS